MCSSRVIRKSSGQLCSLDLNQTSDSHKPTLLLTGHTGTFNIMDAIKGTRSLEAHSPHAAHHPSKSLWHFNNTKTSFQSLVIWKYRKVTAENTRIDAKMLLLNREILHGLQRPILYIHSMWAPAAAPVAEKKIQPPETNTLLHLLWQSWQDVLLSLAGSPCINCCIV